MTTFPSSLNETGLSAVYRSAPLLSVPVHVAAGVPNVIHVCEGPSAKATDCGACAGAKYPLAGIMTNTIINANTTGMSRFSIPFLLETLSSFINLSSSFSYNITHMGIINNE
jgi:hypothetical protein